MIIEREKISGRIKYSVALMCGSRYNWIIVPGTGCQNRLKKAKYEKILMA
jgi:hypothetical protein